MSLECIQNHLGKNWQNIVSSLANGSCRLLKKSDGTNLDLNGFSLEPFEPRTTDFLPCVWNPKSRDKTDAEEVVIAAQTRGRFVYEVKLAQIIGSGEIKAEPSDRLELKIKQGAQARQLEILTVTNESNIAWLIYCVDLQI